MYARGGDDGNAFIKQGAEASVYRSTFLEGLPCVVKVRTAKAYRHPILNMRLTKHRCISEAKLLNRCRSMGIPCPSLYHVDERSGEIIMEWIDGITVRGLLSDYSSNKSSIPCCRAEPPQTDVVHLMRAIGQAIGALHDINVVHGDLTTSNIMVRSKDHEATASSSMPTKSEIILIDFGLGQVSTTDEDKAVDLYVLERAFTSTHPEASELFGKVLQAYAEYSPGSILVVNRLQEVRLRGRKRTMVG